MSISRLSYTCDHGEAVSDCSRCLRADLAKAQAEVAELRARIDRSVCLDSEGERIHFGARVVCGQCFDSQGQHLKNLKAEVAELRDCGGVDGTITPRCGACLACLKAQLADAEKVLEAARALENHEDTCARYVGAVGYDACDCLLGPLIAARDAYDSKWRAGK